MGECPCRSVFASLAGEGFTVTHCVKCDADRCPACRDFPCSGTHARCELARWERHNPGRSTSAYVAVHAGAGAGAGGGVYVGAGGAYVGAGGAYVGGGGGGGYAYPVAPLEQPTQRPPAPAKCECGAEKAGCGPNSHSDWCPKHAVR